MDTKRDTDSLLMIMVTELSKLLDTAKLNKPEKLANLALRLYDYCGKYNIDLEELPEVGKHDIWSMLAELTNEMETYREEVESNGIYIKKCLDIAYKYAGMNNIDLIRKMLRKSAILDKINIKLK